MHHYAQIYEFAASAGSLEVYVLTKKSKDELNLKALDPWVESLVVAYQLLPREILDEIQIFCDQTFGRTIKALIPLVGEDHVLIHNLRLMIAGGLIEPPDHLNVNRWLNPK